MRYKNERIYTYRIDFKTIDESDWGFELIDAHNTDEAIEIFRSYYPIDVYKITDVYRKISGDWNISVR